MNKTVLFLLLCIDHDMDMMELMMQGFTKEMHDALKYIREEKLATPLTTTTFKLSDKGLQVIKLAENSLNNP